MPVMTIVALVDTVLAVMIIVIEARLVVDTMMMIVVATADLHQELVLRSMITHLHVAVASMTLTAETTPLLTLT